MRAFDEKAAIALLGGPAPLRRRDRTDQHLRQLGRSFFGEHTSTFERARLLGGGSRLGALTHVGENTEGAAHPHAGLFEGDPSGGGAVLGENEAPGSMLFANGAPDMVSVEMGYDGGFFVDHTSANPSEGWEGRQRDDRHGR